MQDVYKYIFENMSSGDIKKQVAVELLGKLKVIENKGHKQDDIAIVGMAVNFPKAQNLKEFLENLRNGVDCIRSFPEQRSGDVARYLEARDIEGEFTIGGYLNEIDKFDCKFFNIPPKEARLMDPNQRLFLQTAWNALEDAGYSPEKIKGTKTGVYLGYSSDFGEEYKSLVDVYEPSSKGQSLAGNIKSIIASRISYYLDLKGPSMVVDTACSSSLVAVHLACKALMTGECQIAIAGGVKLSLIPVKTSKDSEVGIASSDGKTKTFDDNSDGTGFGEGVAAIIIKPLKKALEDNDRIYSLIKGGAVNQDGNSIGITAPNAAAQRDLILEAWKNARIDPETISYIEAHGTGTKLGDPIEVSGIEMAFRKHTDKKQFCAIGSVKTNVGHLDNAAGIAGLVKAVLALKYREIFPSLHFAKPNHRINFIDSPVYINEKLREWKSEGTPRRCGINSFGLSGTNCHLVLEEMLEQEKRHDNADMKTQILSISAKTGEILETLVQHYDYFLNHESGFELEDVCYTSAMCRGHYEHRLAIIAGSLEEMKTKIKKVTEKGLFTDSIEGIFYGSHKIITGNRVQRTDEGITEDLEVMTGDLSKLIKSLSEDYKLRASALKEICSLYVCGGSVDWGELYKGTGAVKLGLPAYPFSKRRCWVEYEEEGCTSSIKKSHPLVETCLAESFETGIYKTEFSTEKQWVVNEHRVMEKCVVPGTTYLEMMREISGKYNKGQELELRNIIFMAPLIVEEGKPKEVHTIVRRKGRILQYEIAGLDEGIWKKHAEGELLAAEPIEEQDINIEQLKKILTNEVTIDISKQPTHAIQTGPRWNVIKKLYCRDDEYLAHLRLPREFEEDLDIYKLHPSLMDFAINAANSLIGTYLPFSYKRMRVSGPTPQEFYSYIRRKNREKESLDTVTFDITLTDMSGKSFITVEDYTVRRLNENAAGFETEENLFNKIVWKAAPLENTRHPNEEGSILVLKGKSSICTDVIHKLKEEGQSVIEVDFGNDFKVDNNDPDILDAIRKEEEELNRLIGTLSQKRIKQIVHMSTLGTDCKTETELDESLGQGVYSLFCLTRALIANKIKDDIDIVLVSDFAEEVTGEEVKINPQNAALFGLGKVVGQEYSNLNCRCIDIDLNTSSEEILLELSGESSTYKAVYRDHVRYIEELSKIPAADLESGTFDVKEQGVYLITGGTGGLGLEMAEYLASRNKVNLILINRSALGEKGTRSGGKLARIDEIKELGSSIELCQADVSNESVLKSVIQRIIGKYGRVDGILHCAGIAGDGFILKKDINAFSNVLAPKVKGTWMLDRLTRELKPDFFVMFSSVTSIVGGMGQGDYTAANAFLDSFASYRSKDGQKTVSINWPAWKETGMAVDYGFNTDEGIFKPVSTSGAVKAFESIMVNGFKRAIVGEFNQSSLNNTTLIKELPVKLSDDIWKKKNNPADKSLSNKRKVAEAGSLMSLQAQSIESRMRQIWNRVLGTVDIDINESLNEMGGDSITATQLLKEIEKEFPKTIDISDVFVYPSVRELSGYIRKVIEKKEGKKDEIKNPGQGDLIETLEKLSKGEISIEDMEKLI